MNDLNNLARAPTIPANTNFDNNYSYILRANNIQMTTLTDGIATLSGGYLTGIQLPTEPQDAVPKSYVISSNPAGSAKDIQYNDNGVFAGSDNFQYLGSNSVGTLSIPTVEFTDGTLQINGSYITGLQESSRSSSAITKRYCDFAQNRNYITTISSVSGQTYSAISVVNGTIIRMNSSSSSSQDYLPTATNIVNFINNQTDITGYAVGLTSGSTTGSIGVSGLFYNFSVINESNNNLVLFPNTGTTIISNGSVVNVVVPPYYVLCAYLYIADITAMSSPSVILYVNSIQWSVVYKSTTFQTNFFSDTGYTTGLPYYIKNNLFMPAPTNGYYIITGSAYTYSSTDVNKGIAFRDPTTHASDSFLNILTNGSFIIQNLSTTYNLSIKTTDCTGSWIIFTSSEQTSLSISTAKSSYMWLNNNSSTNTLNVIGTADLNG
jgi:hypothetical protein